MLAISEATKLSSALSSGIPFLAEIKNENDHEQALALMDQLIEDYDNNIIIIEALSSAITRHEESAEEFALFNQRQDNLDPSVSALKVLMEQHNLNTTDFENEIGKRSMVSLVLSGSRSLSREHIAKLSRRFGISPALFF